MSTRAERAARYALRRENLLASELNAKLQKQTPEPEPEPESYGPATYKEIFGESEPEEDEYEIPPPSTAPVKLVRPQPANASEALEMPPLEPVILFDRMHTMS